MSKLTQTISKDFNSLDENAIGTYALKVGLGLTDSHEYSKIVPSAADGLVIIHSYTNSLAVAANGGSVAVARKNDCKQQVLSLLVSWSDYATSTTLNNVLAWKEVGFRLTKETTEPAQPLPVPTTFSTSEGETKGSVALHQNVQTGTKAYVFEYALAPLDGQEPVWHYHLSSKADCLLTGLSSKAEYLFRAGAWNGTTSAAMSGTASRMVQ